MAKNKIEHCAEGLLVDFAKNENGLVDFTFKFWRGGVHHCQVTPADLVGMLNTFMRQVTEKGGRVFITADCTRALAVCAEDLKDFENHALKINADGSVEIDNAAENATFH